MQQITQTLAAARDASGDPFYRITQAIRAYLAFFDDHPDIVELFIQERAIFKDRKRPTYFEYRDANRGAWRELYAQLVAEGSIRDDIPLDLILDTLGHLLYGAMFTNHFIGRSISIDGQQDAIVRIAFDGLLTNAERERRRS